MYESGKWDNQGKKVNIGFINEQVTTVCWGLMLWAHFLLLPEGGGSWVFIHKFPSIICWGRLFGTPLMLCLAPWAGCAHSFVLRKSSGKKPPELPGGRHWEHCVEGIWAGHQHIHCGCGCEGERDEGWGPDCWLWELNREPWQSLRWKRNS